MSPGQGEGREGKGRFGVAPLPPAAPGERGAEPAPAARASPPSAAEPGPPPPADEQRLHPVSHSADSDPARPLRIKYRLFYVFSGTTRRYVPREIRSFSVALTAAITCKN